ncbi:hypothetical protein EOD39_4671 [Acipenser ruthenus]|uniref:Uncharacterized protein n=1 Tax=Acipenser ruthenus TaxID=7906 RepID=A0A662YZC5_ACIRT|nr:hypothetical protein EOD39_4671 [Acipenser ruthenus]
MYPVVRTRPAVLPDEQTPALLLANLQHRGPVLADPEACRGYREDEWISKAPLTFSVPHLISCLGFSTLARLIFTTVKRLLLGSTSVMPAAVRLHVGPAAAPIDPGAEVSHCLGDAKVSDAGVFVHGLQHDILQAPGNHELPVVEVSGWVFPQAVEYSVLVLQCKAFTAGISP